MVHEARPGLRSWARDDRPKVAWWIEEREIGAIFTDCGSEIVRSDARAIGRASASSGRGEGVDARVADDGLMLPLPVISVGPESDCDHHAKFDRDKRRESKTEDHNPMVGSGETR